MIAAYIISTIGFLLSLWIYTFLHKHIVGRPWSFERKLAIAMMLMIFIALILTWLLAAKMLIVESDSLFGEIIYASNINSLGLLCGFAIVLGAFKNNKYFYDKLREEFDPDSIEYEFDMSSTRRRPGYSVKAKASRTTNIKLLFSMSFIVAISSAIILKQWFDPDTPPSSKDVVNDGKNAAAPVTNTVANNTKMNATSIMNGENLAAVNAPIGNTPAQNTPARAKPNWPSIEARD